MIGPDVVESLKNFHYSAHKFSRNNNIKRIRLPYARVLVVDDVPTNLMVAKGLLKPYAMKVDCVTSGMEAIDAMMDEEVRYNAIFMDHMMPEMDGIEAARLIRNLKTEYTDNIPIIALTANAICGNEKMFLKNGFQAFLTKPMDLSRLDEVIRRWIRNKELEALHEDSIHDLEPDDTTKSSLRDDIDWFKLDHETDGVNIIKGLNRYNGEEELYYNALKSYSENTPGLLSKIENVDKDNLYDYQIIVHGIKGASAIICADIIAEDALNLEMSAKNGDYGYILAHNEPFIYHVRKLVEIVNELISKITIIEQKTFKDKPDQSLLDKLKTACEDFDMDAVDEITNELASYEYESDNDLIKSIYEHAKHFDTAEIIELLSGR